MNIPILSPLVKVLGSQKAVVMLLAIAAAYVACMLGKITVEQFGTFVGVTLPAWLVAHAGQDGLKALAAGKGTGNAGQAGFITTTSVVPMNVDVDHAVDVDAKAP